MEKEEGIFVYVCRAISLLLLLKNIAASKRGQTSGTIMFMLKGTTCDTVTLKYWKAI